jgi:hypothetical protein
MFSFALMTDIFAVTSWSDTSTEVVRVWTNKQGSTPYITIKQDKGTFRYYSIADLYQKKEKKAKGYAYYNVEIKPVSNIDGGKTNYKVKKAVLKNGSLKIKLEKDTYYEIVIKYNVWFTNDQIYTPGKNPPLNNSGNWVSNPVWSVQKVSNCGNYA